MGLCIVKIFPLNSDEGIHTCCIFLLSDIMQLYHRVNPSLYPFETIFRS